MKNFKTLLLLLCVPVFIFSQINPVKINSKNFTFVVLGDRTASANQPIFDQVIGTIKSLNPDFIVNVGDLVEGYSNSSDMINSEWDSIFTNLGFLKTKFYFTPGNHDASDSLSLSIYLSRNGYKKSYYSFSVGKNRFIVLDNSQQEKANEPDPVQLQWLISELSKYKKNDNIFCFMHKSFWFDEYKTSRADTFHKLFVKYGVDYVFSGHDHHYVKLVWDGITYTMVGPSGSRYKLFRKEEFGAFQNFLLVSIKNDKVQFRVIRPDGSELSADYVTFDNIKQLEGIEQAINISPFIVGKSDSVFVKINNVFEIPISTNCSWWLDNKTWQIVPDAQAVIIPGQNTYNYSFSIKVKNESIYPLPQFNISYPYETNQKRYKYNRMLPIELNAECRKISKTIKIDGRLNEKIWQDITPIHVFGSGDGGVSQTDPWEVYFAYDPNNLYIAARMTDYEPDNISTTITQRDDKVYNDDHINIILQPGVASDTYYQFFINANGVVMDRACYMMGKDSKKDAKWNSDINVKAEISSGEKFTGWTLEASLPLKQFVESDPKTWGFNLVRFQKRKDAVSICSVPFEHNPKTFASLNFTK